MGPRITPWADEAEWQYVKSSFYPRGHPSVTDDPRLRAIERVKAWMVRGRVPHAVVATQQLTAALLRDQSSTLSSVESRMLLAMALTRFVNGLLDPAQQAAYAISMTSLAKTIGLPESFVEIRHSATHDTLPSLPVLRGALPAALDWLWHNYWNVPDVAVKTAGASTENEAETAAHIDSLLKQWKKARKVEPTRPLKTGDNNPITKQSLVLLKDLSKIKDSPSSTRTLIDRLISPKLLLSANPATKDIWVPLLEQAVKTFSSLRNNLILRAVDVLGRDVEEDILPFDKALLGPTPDRPDIVNIDGSYDRLRSWLSWFLTAKIEGEIDVRGVSTALSTQKDRHTLAVMRDLEGDARFDMPRLIALRLGRPLPTARVSVGEQVADATGTLGKRRAAAVDDPADEIVESTTSGAWRRVRPRVVRPIGHLIT